MEYGLLETPIGLLTVRSGPGGVERISFGPSIPGPLTPNAPSVEAVRTQLVEYFSGERKSFALPLALRGTPFQLQVWRQLLLIPYGETRSYGQIAQAVGRPRAARAVGMANHENPIPIIVPCHRVIGHDGTLTGYGGGLGIKAYLLKLEGALTMKEPSSTGTRTRGRSTGLQPVLSP